MILLLLSLVSFAGEDIDSSDPTDGWEDAKAILKQIKHDDTHGSTQLCYRMIGNDLLVQLYEREEKGTRPVAGAFGPTLTDAVEGLPSDPRFGYVAAESVVPCEPIRVID